MSDNPTVILLAEDDAELRGMYQARLEAEGYTVAIATDGEQALALLKSESPKLVILDIMMPKMNGIDVLKNMKQNPATADIPVIVATALVHDMTEVKRLLSTNDAYLVKSEVMPKDIVALVKEKLAATA